MPVKLRKLKGGKVQVSTPNGVKSKGTSMENAKSQERLLNAIDHGWVPGNDAKENRRKFKAYAKARGRSVKTSISV